jgi:hypothetical protein
LTIEEEERETWTAESLRGRAGSKELVCPVERDFGGTRLRILPVWTVGAWFGASWTWAFAVWADVEPRQTCDHEAEIEVLNPT